MKEEKVDTVDLKIHTTKLNENARENTQGEREEFIAFARTFGNCCPAFNGIEPTLGPKYGSITARVTEGFDAIQ